MFRDPEEPVASGGVRVPQSRTSRRKAEKDKQSTSQTGKETPQQRSESSSSRNQSKNRDTSTESGKSTAKVGKTGKNQEVLFKSPQRQKPKKGQEAERSADSSTKGAVPKTRSKTRQSKKNAANLSVDSVGNTREEQEAVIEEQRAIYESFRHTAAPPLPNEYAVGYLPPVSTTDAVPAQPARVSQGAPAVLSPELTTTDTGAGARRRKTAAPQRFPQVTQSSSEDWVALEKTIRTPTSDYRYHYHNMQEAVKAAGAISSTAEARLVVTAPREARNWTERSLVDDAPATFVLNYRVLNKISYSLQGFSEYSLCGKENEPGTIPFCYEDHADSEIQPRAYWLVADRNLRYPRAQYKVSFTQRNIVRVDVQNLALLKIA
jgi:hypothetical protein